MGDTCRTPLPLPTLSQLRKGAHQRMQPEGQGPVTQPQGQSWAGGADDSNFLPPGSHLPQVSR